MEEPYSPTMEKVMIIEDEKDLCFLLSAAFKKNNVKSQCAYSLREALKTITDVKPSIVFLDNHLPDGYGSDFIGTVKKLFPSAKIIMITAYDSPSDIKLAFSRGADYFIGKPFNTISINTALEMVHMDTLKKAV